MRLLSRPRPALSKTLAGVGLLTVSMAGLAACTPTAPAYETARVEAENLVGARVLADPTASAGLTLGVVSNGTATGSLRTPVAATWIDVKARGDQCAGAPVMSVVVDGRAVSTTAVATTSWKSYGTAGAWTAGTHTVAIRFANDFRSATCDRNLRVDTVTFRSGAQPPPQPGSGNELSGAALWADPASPAATRAVAVRQAGDVATAELLERIGSQATASWFTDATPAGAVAAAVRARVDAVTAAGKLPLLVAYAIPGRDCGGHSSGGLTTSAAYASWIGNLAAGVGSRRAVVVLEPDAVAQWNCLTATARTTRITDLRNAVDALTASGSIAVYLDGGHSNWQTPEAMADRLRAVGVDRVRGFATNVANFNPTPAETAYGDRLAALLGKHYVVDTSRNGRGPAAEWCNPPDQGLGPRPSSATTGAAAADGYLWVKRPGESDGSCHDGDPSAGAWFESYALGLAQRAAG